MSDVTEIHPIPLRCDWDGHHFWITRTVDGKIDHLEFSQDEAAIIYEQLSIMNQPWGLA